MPGGTRPDGRLEVHVAARVPAEEPRPPGMSDFAYEWMFGAGAPEADARDAAAHDSHRQISMLSERLQAMSIMMHTLSEEQLLSDHVKSVVYREKDREAVRRALLGRATP